MPELQMAKADRIALLRPETINGLTHLHRAMADKKYKASFEDRSKARPGAAHNNPTLTVFL